MSKIGNYNLELEEELRDQLNELGFESLQEALDAGWELYEGELVKRKDELTKAHEAWLKEREEVLDIVNHLKSIIEHTYDGEEFDPDTAAAALRYSDVLKIKNFIEEAHD